MKLKTFPPLVAFVAMSPALPATGAEIAKLPDSTLSIPFSEASAWAGGVVPGSSDVALFDSTMGTSILGSMNTTQSWYGMKITNPQGVNVSNGYSFSAVAAGGTFLGNLALGAGGIDMSMLNLPTPPPSTVGLAVGVPLALTADQSWQIADNATTVFELGLNGPTSGSTVRPIDLGGHTVTKTGAGAIGVTFNNLMSNGVINLQAGSLTFVNGLTSSSSSTYLNAIRSNLTLNAAAGTSVNLSQVVGLGKTDWQGALHLTDATLAVNPYSTSISNIDIGGTLATSGSSTITYTNAGSSTSVANPTISAPVTGSGTLSFLINTTAANRQSDRFTLSGSTSGFTGTFALTGASGLRTVRLAGPAANSPAAAWQVVDGGTLEVVAAAGSFAALQTGGTVRVGASNGSSGVLTTGSLVQTAGILEADIGTLEADQFSITGAYVNTGGGLQVNLQSAPSTLGVYTPMTYGSLSGTPSVTFSPALADTRFTAAPVVGSLALSLLFSGGSETRTWIGTNGTDPWDLNTTAAWSGGDQLFKQLDTVVFDDSAASTTPVIGVNVVPHSILINNPTKTYSFTAAGTAGIGGAGAGVTKSGAGLASVAGTNTFVGPVVVDGGTFQMGSAQALGFSKGVTVAAGAVLDFNGKSAGSAGRGYDLTISGTGIGGTGAVVNNNATSILSSSTALLGSGIRNLTLAADASIGGNATGHFDLANGGTITGNNHVLTKVGSNQVNLNGPATNLTTVVQAGSLYGASPGSFGSALTIRSGAKAGPAFAGDFTIPATVETGGTLDINSPLDAIWSGTLTLGTSVNFGASATTGALILPQNFTTAANIAKTGTGTVRLTGNSTFTGSLAVSAGTLALGNGGNTGLAGTSAITVASGATLEVNHSDSFTLGNPLSGAGGFRKTGAGTLTANSVPTGALGVAVGSLLLDAPVAVGTVTVSGGAKLRCMGTAGATSVSSGPGGMISVGTSASGIGTLSTTTFSLGAYATYGADIDSNSGTADKIAASGNVTLTAQCVLAVSNLSNVLPAGGTKFTILTYGGTLTGTFAGLPEGATLNVAGIPYVIRYSDGGKNVTLTATLTPYQIWVAAYYPGVTDPAVIGQSADGDKDGLSNMLEYVLGSDPASGVVTTTPFTQITGSSYDFYFLRSIAAGGAGYVSVVEYSESLASGSWTVVPPEMTTVVNNGDGTETVKASVLLLPGQLKLFTRIRVTAP